jgi:hypothetical protein
MALDRGLFSHDMTGASGSEMTTLLWRLPPEESYSDWKIEVHVAGETLDEGSNFGREETSPVIFHVHRAILANGPRHSQYFKKLFLSNTAENINQTSIIRLERSAALVFPAMLDFVYDFGKDVVVDDPGAATALRHLANYFGIQELFENVNTTFINVNLSVDTAFAYMEEATKFHEISLRDAAIDYIAERVLRVDNEMLYRMPVEWFSRLMAKVAVTDRNVALVVGYVIREPEGLTVDHVSQWLERFKSIPPRHALSMLSIAVAFNVDETIKHKCVTSCSRKWADLARVTANSSSNKDDEELYSKLPDNEKVKLLEESLRKAEIEFTELKDKAVRGSAKSSSADA